MTSTTTTDHLILQRRIDGERTPRFYTMTGGPFATLLEAVKGLPFRHFEEMQLKSWLLHGDGIAALRAQGYTIVPDALFRVAPLVRTSVYDHIDRIDATVYFQERDRSGGWRSMPVYANIEIVGVTTAIRQVVANAIDARRASLGLQLAPARHDDVVQEIAQRAVALYGPRIIHAFGDGLHDRWTDKAYDQAMAVVEELLEQDQVVHRSRLAIQPDGTVVDYDHAAYPALVTAYETAVEERRIGEQQAQAQRQAERKANAPQLVRAWFGRCRKREIIQIVAERAGRHVNARLPKPQLIDELTSDRALCETLIA